MTHIGCEEIKCLLFFCCDKACRETRRIIAQSSTVNNISIFTATVHWRRRSLNNCERCGEDVKKTQTKKPQKTMSSASFYICFKNAALTKHFYLPASKEACGAQPHFIICVEPERSSYWKYGEEIVSLA